MNIHNDSFGEDVGYLSWEHVSLVLYWENTAKPVSSKAITEDNIGII